jgi:hypothetical protein
MDGPGIESRWGRDFSHTSTPALGPTQLPVKWVPGIKRSWHGADHPPSSSAEVENEWRYTSSPPLGPYLLTPWSTVLLQKLTGLCSYSRNSPHFYGTRRLFPLGPWWPVIGWTFTFTRTRHLSLQSQISVVQAFVPRPVCWREWFCINGDI